MYCGYPNATKETGPCASGYYCRQGSNTDKPESSFTGDAGPCPPGRYCPQNTTEPLLCPQGTYSNRTHLQKAGDCNLCRPSYFCGSEGRTNVSGECHQGFYCLFGSKVPNPNTVTASGGPCPVGHYCPTATSYPLGCKEGTYNNQTGQSQCQPCCSGFYCPANSTSCIHSCPTGHYCPSSTRYPTQFACPRGTYNKYTGKQKVDDCNPCDAGKYCPTPGKDAPEGDCSAGWYCRRGAWSPKPTDFGSLTCGGNVTYNSSTCYCPNATSGDQCQPGEFCPAGSSQPTPCTAGR